MNKMSVYPYISAIKRNHLQTNCTNPSDSFNGKMSVVKAAPTSDVVSLRNEKDIYLDKLNVLFPDGGIEKLYNDINKDFGIDKPADLKFYGKDDGVMAGGFTFEKNEIALSLSDLLDYDTKIIGIKNGKKVTLTSPSCKLPLFIDRKSAESFINIHSKHGNLGFDELLVEPLTEDDQRKYITQKIAHEVIHSQQHMIMRQTEGIGAKEIIKAWTHAKPKNMIEKAILELQVQNSLQKSYWKDIPDETKISKNSSGSLIAHIWLEAVRNYPKVDSPEYTRNPIEQDAYLRSFEYVKNKYGNY